MQLIDTRPLRLVRTRPRIRVRPLADGEAEVVRAVLKGLSARSRMLRFHAPVPRVTDTMARQLARVGDGRTVLVAERATADGWRPVGLAHLGPEGPGVAELAVAVTDDHQGQGIGRRLVAALREAVEAAGHERVVAHVLEGNDPVLHLLRAVFPTARIRAEGHGVLRVQAEVGAGTLSTDDVLADLMQVC